MTSKQTDLLQPYQISRAIYRCDSLERKILFYAALLVQKQERKNARERYIAQFGVKELLTKLGLTYTTSMRDYIKTAIKTIASNTIILHETDKYLNVITWLQQGIYDDDNDTIQIIFSDTIGELFTRCHAQFSLISPRVIGALKSYYSMRFYEIAMSYAGYQGLRGNPPNTWYFDYSLTELREMFSITGYNNKYGTQNFLKKIVQQPIAELNAANPDFKISVEKIKDENDGRKLAGIRFICQKTSRKRKTTGEKMRIQLEKDAAETANEYSAYLAQGGDLMQSLGGLQ
jgi:plasmid replication initiation protein